MKPADPPAPGAVAAAIARAIAPAEAEDSPPAWLRPHQVRSFRRALAAVRRFGGALLADPVGTGKTYVALAVAARIAPNQPVAAVVPAILLDQWARTGRSLGLDFRLLSHEMASRGRAPDGSGFVLIDESHRFRHAGTKRYATLAPALVGRRGLLVSATPVINRLDDLANQLLLLVRDDALRLGGIPSLKEALHRDACPALLSELVIAGPAGLAGRPDRRERVVPGLELESPDGEALCRRLDQLLLSRAAPVAALIRTVLLRALASSPAALAVALRRYRRLLGHAIDAHRAGRRLTRGELLQAIRGQEDQLVWWELLQTPEAATELVLEDRPRLGGLLRLTTRLEHGEDPKARRLAATLADGTSTLVFCTAVETVHYLRRRLGLRNVAWCAGALAGVGGERLSRPTVLSWFRPGADHPSAGLPRLLVTTDVAAEGLDLQRIARVVHYDLPWTAVRLEQRDGRAVRLGAAHPFVEVVRFELPPCIEARLRLAERLHRKSGLPARVGLGEVPDHAWRWRVELAARFAGGEAHPGRAAVLADHGGALGAIELVAAGGERVGLVLAADDSGRWWEDGETIERHLTAVERGEPLPPPNRVECAAALATLMPEIRRLVGVANGRTWIAPEPSPPLRALAGTLRQLAQTAARGRDTRLLVQAERGLRFLRGGGTAGELALAERLSVLPPAELLSRLERLPVSAAEPGPVSARIVALLVLVANPNPASSASGPD